jgi:hypothetical protein
MYQKIFASEQLFANMLNSSFTMLQIMTLDGWGEIGRLII